MNCYHLFVLACIFSSRANLAISDATGGDGADEIVDRIVGGEFAAEGEFPSFVQWDGCGASLIHSDIVLTAAHCAPIVSSNVLVGAYAAWTPQGYPVNSVMRTIVERKVHPLWNPDTLNYDFMLLRLDEKVDLPPVRLDSSGVLDAAQSVTVVGFGSTQGRVEVSYNNSESDPSIYNPFNDGDYYWDEIFTTRADILRKVVINHVDDSICNQFWEGLLNLAVMVCAGTEEGGKDACFGDSGGPLYKQIGTEYIQVGVVSFGYGCARPQTPGVYSRISGAYAWINAAICEISTEKPAYCFATNAPTAKPTVVTRSPTLQPYAIVTASPPNFPSPVPSDSQFFRSSIPSDTPSFVPSAGPTHVSSSFPLDMPSLTPSGILDANHESASTELSRPPTMQPTVTPALTISIPIPTSFLSSIPSDTPSLVPSAVPTPVSSSIPPDMPSLSPTLLQEAPTTTGGIGFWKSWKLPSLQPTVQEMDSENAPSPVKGLRLP